MLVAPQVVEGRSAKGRRMESTAARQALEKSVNPAALSTQERRMPPESATDAASAPEKKAIGYGLPCSRCHAYYPADMHVCPICKSPDRVSPTASVSYSTAPAAPQPAALAHNWRARHYQYQYQYR